MSRFTFDFDIALKGFSLNLHFAWESANRLKPLANYAKTYKVNAEQKRRQRQPRVNIDLFTENSFLELRYDRDQGTYSIDTGSFCPLPNGVSARGQRPHGDRDMAVRPPQ